MVAIRSAHLNFNQQFHLDRWISSLEQDKDTAESLKEVYRHCEMLLFGHKDSELLLWRGREMIEILVTLSMDKVTLISAQLFPLASSGEFDREVFKKKYGKEIARLIDGVEKMAVIGQLDVILKGTEASRQVDSVRRMLLAMVEDFRCVIIKLAERIANLLEVKEAEDNVRQTASKECANIYAPLANRLGIGQLQWEIEDYVFRYQHPDIYKLIAEQLSERRIVREEYIKNFVGDLIAEMIISHINVEVSGRAKHIYSIWRKMQKKGLDFDELFDVQAVRVIAEKLQDCYAALGVVHTKYEYLPGEFDDYIANPKPNGYQSIHTVVLGPKNKTIEIQIRTKDMHENSELGVAAHWKYKEGSTGTNDYDKKIAWLRKLLDWQEEMLDSDEILGQLRGQVFDDRIYAFTPKGDVIDLPMGSTPLDFAYYVHSEVGHRCIGAKVNGRIAAFPQKLKMGDQVEIITQKESNPSYDWLNPATAFVYSTRARKKISSWFRKQSNEKNIEVGREILEDKLVKIGATLKQAEDYALRYLNLNTLSELYFGVGSGALRINQIVNHINASINKLTIVERSWRVSEKLKESKNRVAQKQLRADAIVVNGVNDLMIYLARCCQPIPGERIKGYITQGRGISVHSDDCAQLAELSFHVPKRIIDTAWGNGFIGFRILTIRIEALKRRGLLKDVIASLAYEKIQVTSVASYSDYKEDQFLLMDFDLGIADIEVFLRICKRIKQIKGVMSVKRMS
ncbi:GTP pyrophosphokinase [Candidatus Photodesmus blepharus]|uniref:GTP pyrophosphokinase n=1 Tax=Candidatus Photodesmus blepharonis TaxID=1179155 RepID=A0A084CNV1_9GAMM|nr:GTP diphosphokinase [Candidatus Photodesmus blepharus]KEY91480.1 GTP pyrophosphokinase [Candidatus Photodesmus blepharus]